MELPKSEQAALLVQLLNSTGMPFDGNPKQLAGLLVAGLNLLTPDSDKAADDCALLAAALEDLFDVLEGDGCYES